MTTIITIIILIASHAAAFLAGAKNARRGMALVAAAKDAASAVKK